MPEEKVKRNRAAVDQALQLLEDQFLGDKAFLTSQQVTLADLMALEELMQVRAWLASRICGQRPLTAALRPGGRQGPAQQHRALLAELVLEPRPAASILAGASSWCF